MTRIHRRLRRLLFCTAVMVTSGLAGSAHAADNAGQHNNEFRHAPTPKLAATPAVPPPADRDAPGLASVAGLYWCVAPSWNAGTINLLPDGSYQVNGYAAGRYSVRPGQVRFDGQLKTWNNGAARIENGTLIFEWTADNGAKRYFAYSRSKG